MNDKSKEKSKDKTVIDRSGRKNYSEQQIKSQFHSLGLTRGQMEKSKKTNPFSTIFRSVIGAQNIDQIYSGIGKSIYSVTGQSVFKDMEKAMLSTGYKIVPHIYVGQAVLASIIIFLLSAIYLYINAIFLHMIPLSPIMSAIIPFIASLGTFAGFYYNPIQKMNDKARNININLPFALTHLAAISSAGSPPAEAFRIFSRFEEFGSIRDESKEIVKRIDVFGEDLTTALKNVRDITPSLKFKKVLSGMLTIINTGGSLNEYLNSMAEEFMFDYKIAREKYLDTLGTYADIYTAILIAAPLFLVATLAVLNIIPDVGNLPGGFSISAILFGGVYLVIPAMNLIFIAFVTATSPDV